MDGNCNVGWPPSDGNGRDGGGSAGSEHHYKFPAADSGRWSEVSATIAGSAKWQGEAGQVIGAYINTMQGGRGTIMGETIPRTPERGFTSAGGGPRPNPGIHR